MDSSIGDIAVMVINKGVAPMLTTAKLTRNVHATLFVRVSVRVVALEAPEIFAHGFH